MTHAKFVAKLLIKDQNLKIGDGYKLPAKISLVNDNLSDSKRDYSSSDIPGSNLNSLFYDENILTLKNSATSNNTLSDLQRSFIDEIFKGNVAVINLDDEKSLGHYYTFKSGVTGSSKSGTSIREMSLLEDILKEAQPAIQQGIKDKREGYSKLLKINYNGKNQILVPQTLPYNQALRQTLLYPDGVGINPAVKNEFTIVNRPHAESSFTINPESQDQ
ncbi:MAG: hypothetical protein HRT47_14185 [Candidatus Caenarcaniphilales bacterium]|nr:hypothetical protein [Candidatus Caenarcaniphilales bacterium]